MTTKVISLSIEHLDSFRRHRCISRSPLITISFINVLSNLSQLFIFFMHGDSVTRYTQTDSSGFGHLIPDHFTVLSNILNKAVSVALMSLVHTSTKTRHIFDHILVCVSELI